MTVTAEPTGDPHPGGSSSTGGFAFAGRGARWAVRLLAVAALPLLAACTADPQTTETASTPSPFAECAGLTRMPSSAATGSPAGAAELPDLELPCFTGGTAVELTRLRGPAVINLWASWCAPCRAELPAMQQLADQAAGKLTVFGVDTRDGRDAAASFAADGKVVMPTLFDPEQKLISALGRTTLPVTVFLAADGSSHVESLPLDDTKLDALVETWTGVKVTP